MSAVKNLRAMFEQKGEISPPDRGRSPGIPHATSAESPRPLSRVRTNFIAVEKDGRIGLQREGSQDSISATRKPSGESNASTPMTGTTSANPFDTMAKTHNGLPSHSILESPQVAKDAALPAQEAKGGNPGASAGTGTGSNKTGLDGPTAKEGSAAGSENLQPEAQSVNGTRSGKDQQGAGGKDTKPVARTTKSAPKPLAASSGSKPSAKPEKSPAAHNAPKTPAGTAPHNPAARKTPEKKTQQPEKTVTPGATAAPSKPTGPSSSNKPTPLHCPPQSSGFVKPKPKSPTRPIKLPPSLTTHTASSGSKVNAPRQSLSRASGSINPADPHGRAPSRTSATTAGTASKKPDATKGLKRQSSTINRPRPSLGLPPKQPTKDHPPVKKEKVVDEGFLARMMRPTQSSASKAVHSPPRKPVAAAPNKVSAVKPMKKVAPKPAGKASSSGQPQTSAAKQIAAGAEQAATAEEAIATAKAADGEATLPATAGQGSAAPEAAPTAEQSETAPAKEAGDEALLAQPSKASNAAEVEASPTKSKEPEPEPLVSAEEPTVNGHDGPEKAEPVMMETSEATSAEAADSAETAGSEMKVDESETKVA
ncbi:hypothetical protein VTK56DRAFT_6999 [Thermocarpiscus australiensis]